MAHEKTWQYAMNVDHGDTSSGPNQLAWTLWWLKEFLIGNVPLTDQAVANIASPVGLWEVAGSSDAVTGGMDGVDRWGATYDPTKIIHASGSGTAHSWIVLHNPSLGVWLNLDLVNASSTPTYGGNVLLSLVAPTGGSNTTRPTATNEMITGDSRYNYLISPSTAGAGRRVHGLLAEDGSFFVLSSVNNSFTFQSHIFVHKLADGQPGDNNLVIAGANSQPTCDSAFALITSSSGMESGTGDFLGQFPSAGCAAHSFSGAAIKALGMFYFAGSNPGYLQTKYLGGTPRADGKYRRAPFWIIGQDYREKGRMVDVYMSQMLQVGTVFPSLGAPEYMQVGTLLLPTNAVPLL